MGYGLTVGSRDGNDLARLAPQLQAAGAPREVTVVCDLADYARLAHPGLAGQQDEATGAVEKLVERRLSSSSSRPRPTSELTTDSTAAIRRAAHPHHRHHP
jgi:hypothetical protein